MCTRFQASPAKKMRTDVLWVVTQRVVVPYRRFGTTYPSTCKSQESKKDSHLQESRIKIKDYLPLKMELIGFPETSVRNYYLSLHNNP